MPSFKLLLPSNGPNNIKFGISLKAAVRAESYEFSRRCQRNAS